MFTGLIEDTAEIVALVPEGEGVRISIRTRIPLAEVAIGDSIACDGACLTVVEALADVFTVVAARETIARTTFGRRQLGDRLHLERALRVGDRLDGHIVQGHVDGVGRIASLTQAQESVVVWIELPHELAGLVAEKGSLTVDGVSLTVNEVAGRNARVNLIPHTVAQTKLGASSAGDFVNIEVDVLARYVARSLAWASSSEPSKLADLLKPYASLRSSDGGQP